MANRDNGSVLLCGLWLNKDKNGNPFFSGNLTATAALMVFKNTKKTKGSKEPDYRAVIVQRDPQQRGESAQRHDDDVPF